MEMGVLNASDMKWNMILKEEVTSSYLENITYGVTSKKHLSFSALQDKISNCCKTNLTK